MTKKSKILPQEDDKNCQFTKYYDSMCSDKNCQVNISMWPVMSEMNKQVPKPAVRRLCNDKNC